MLNIPAWTRLANSDFVDDAASRRRKWQPISTSHKHLFQLQFVASRISSSFSEIRPIRFVTRGSPGGLPCAIPVESITPRPLNVEVCWVLRIRRLQIISTALAGSSRRLMHLIHSKCVHLPNGRVELLVLHQVAHALNTMVNDSELRRSPASWYRVPSSWPVNDCYALDCVCRIIRKHHSTQPGAGNRDDAGALATGCRGI